MKHTSDFVGSWLKKKDLFIMKTFTCSSYLLVTYNTVYMQKSVRFFFKKGGVKNGHDAVS